MIAARRRRRARPAGSLVRRVHALDERLLASTAAARSPGRSRWLVGLTRAANYSRLWLAVAGVLACDGPAGRRAAGRGLAAIAIAAPIANGPAKLLVRRRRPRATTSASLIGLPRSSSFPSGHSAAAFAFATAASVSTPALAPLLLPLAGAVAYSRVYTGVHYPSDVIGGIAIGACCGALVALAPPRQRRRSPARDDARARAGWEAAQRSGRRPVAGTGKGP